MVTRDASKTGLGITLWLESNGGEIKLTAFGSRYLNDTEKDYSIGELDLLAVACSSLFRQQITTRETKNRRQNECIQRKE